MVCRGALRPMLPSSPYSLPPQKIFQRPFRPILPSAPYSLPPILPSAPYSRPPHTPVRPILPSAPGSRPPHTPVRPRLPSAPGSVPPQAPFRPRLPLRRRLPCVLAGSLFHQGKLSEAEQMLQAVLAGQQCALGPTHPDTTQTANSLEGVRAHLRANPPTNAAAPTVKPLPLPAGSCGGSSPSPSTTARARACCRSTGAPAGTRWR